MATFTEGSGLVAGPATTAPFFERIKTGIVNGANNQLSWCKVLGQSALVRTNCLIGKYTSLCAKQERWCAIAELKSVCTANFDLA